MDLTHIDNTIAADFSLNYNGNYNTLINTNNFSLSWGNIFDAFIILSKTNASNRNWNNLWPHLARVIVTTSESIRFRSIFNLISNEIQTYSNELSWNNDISNIVTNWQSRSNNIIDAINNIQSRFGNNNGVINEWFYNLLSQLPLNTIAQALANTDVRVILGLLLQPTLNCNKKTRSINNNIKNEYCDAIKDKNEGYNLGNRKVTVIKILNENTKVGKLQAGDIYIGTTSGVFLWFKRDNQINVHKFNGLDSNIEDMWFDGQGSIFVKTNNLKYHLNLHGWDNQAVCTSAEALGIVGKNTAKGAITGALIGASVGTAIFPIIGTGIGTFIGSVFGSGAGASYSIVDRISHDKCY
ncbi:ribosome-inactivating family protein [Spiroplasma endosymbiont of Seladonia tumulorum]|uniref:ribosome-inactivating family protein n=1 Tax=Spiroplasma endosymbiont of Seladonia tumulorum TaxID=3066321 RepID=UPI0030CA6F41